MRKKIPDRYSQWFPVVVLYAGDIDHLVSIFRTSESATVSFEHGDIVYETLAELREHQGEVLREFELVVETSGDEIGYTRSSVDFKSDCVYLSSESAHELPFRQAKDFLELKCRWVGKVHETFWVLGWMALPTLPLAVGYALALYFNDKTVGIVILVLSGALYVAIQIAIFRVSK